MSGAAFNLPHLASRVFGTPLKVARPKLDAILSVLAPRLGIAAPLAQVDFQAKERSGLEVTDDGIARVQIIGTLVQRASGMEAASGMTSYSELADEIDRAAVDQGVRAILLEIDSPGGEVAGLAQVLSAVSAACAKKPCVAVANELAASAAYEIASCCDTIYVPPTGVVGSIGVLALHVDQSGLDQKTGLAFTYIHAGAQKVDGNSHEPLSPRARDTIQGEVDQLYDMFVKTVAENRGLSQKAVRATEAATFMGEDAVSDGLADEIGTLEDALSGLRSELKRRANVKLHAAAIAALKLPADASEEVAAQAITDLAAKHASLEVEASADRAKIAALEAQAKDVEGKKVTREADHVVELARVASKEGGLEPLPKDVEEDARALFAIGKPDMAKRAIDRHMAAARSKKSVLKDPGVRTLNDEEPKSPTSKAGILAKAKTNAAALMAAGKGKKRGATATATKGD